MLNQVKLLKNSNITWINHFWKAIKKFHFTVKEIYYFYTILVAGWQMFQI